MHQLQAKPKFVYGNSIFFEILQIYPKNFAIYTLLTYQKVDNEILPILKYIDFRVHLKIYPFNKNFFFIKFIELKWFKSTYILLKRFVSPEIWSNQLNTLGYDDPWPKDSKNGVQVKRVYLDLYPFNLKVTILYI